MLVFAAALIAIVGTALYGIAAYVVYDEVSRTTDPNPGRYADVTPANLRFSDAGVTFDFSRFETPDYSDVRFASRDPGIEVAGWFMPGDDGAPAVVVSHGLRASRHDPAALVPAGMLHTRGFSVLVIDLRDHGDSTFEDGRYAGGSEEQADVLGAVDWLTGRGVPVEHIGLFGTSMGAGATLIAAAFEPRIEAIWEDSSYADTETRIREELRNRGYPELLAPAAPIVARIVAGDDLSSWTPLSAVRSLGDAGLVRHPRRRRSGHGGASRFGPLRSCAGIESHSAEMWIAPGMGHTEAYRLLTDEYEARLIRFFDDHLGRTSQLTAAEIAVD